MKYSAEQVKQLLAMLARADADAKAFVDELSKLADHYPLIASSIDAALAVEAARTETKTSRPGAKPTPTPTGD